MTNLDSEGFGDLTHDATTNQPAGGMLLPAGEELGQTIAERYAEALKRAEDLLSAGARLPSGKDDRGNDVILISTDEQDAKATQFVKQIQTAVKTLDSARTGEKSRYDAAADQIHAQFRGPMDKLDMAKGMPGLKQRVEAAQTAHKRRIADAEKKRREEEAAQKRREEEEARAKASRIQAEADEAAARAARARNPEKKAAAAQEAAALAESANAASEKLEEVSGDRAGAEKAAAAPLADMSRSRGYYGGVSSLRTFWDFRDLDREALDLEKLREHLPQAALEQAVRALIKAGGRECKGVVIFENSKTANH